MTRQTKLWKVLFKYDRLPDHFHNLQTTLQIEFSLLKKTTSKNIKNLQDAINLQQTHTTPLCSHVNSIYTKLAQLDRQIQTHCLYPHSQSDSVQLNALEYDSEMVKHSYCWTYNHQCHHIPRTLKKIQPKSPPIQKNTPHFHRILIGLNLSPNQFRIVQNIQYTRTPNNPRKSTQPTTDPN